MTQKKTVTFHRMCALGNGKRLNVPDCDWTTVMTSLAKEPFEKLTDSVHVFEPGTTEDDIATVGIHAPLNTAFMSQLDPQTHKASDLLAKTKSAKRFAHSTAVAFLPSGNVFALALGGTHSPRASQVANFLNLTYPLPDASWKTEPLIDTDRLTEFQEHGKGVVEFSSRFTTARNLFSQEPTGVLGLADQIASRIEGDVEVEMRVKIAGTPSKSAVERLYGLIREDLPRVVGAPFYRTRAETVMDDDTRETLNLVATRFAVETEVGRGVTESQSFSELMAETVRVSAAQHTRVRQLLRG